MKNDDRLCWVRQNTPVAKSVSYPQHTHVYTVGKRTTLHNVLVSEEARMRHRLSCTCVLSCPPCRF